jgi:hypothetical protein
MNMNRTEQADPTQAFKVNSIAALGMTLATAATLLLLRPELFLVFIAYVGMSVFSLSIARTYGLLGQRRPVIEQNFAAYVSISTVGFIATLFGAPQMIELFGSMIFVLVAIVMAILVLYSIIDRK